MPVPRLHKRKHLHSPVLAPGASVSWRTVPGGASVENRTSNILSTPILWSQAACW